MDHVLEQWFMTRSPGPYGGPQAGFRGATKIHQRAGLALD